MAIARRKQPKSRVLETMEYMADYRKQPMLSIVRRDLTGLEKPYIWQAAILNVPGRRLVMELRQPWMNFKEGREVLAKLLGKDPHKLKFSAVRGGRTYYPNEEELEILTEEDTGST